MNMFEKLKRESASSEKLLSRTLFNGSEISIKFEAFII